MTVSTVKSSSKQLSNKMIIDAVNKIKYYLTDHGMSRNGMTNLMAINYFAEMKYGEKIRNPFTKLECENWLIGKIRKGDIDGLVRTKGVEEKKEPVLDTKMPYHLFLRTPYWQSVRLAVFTKQGRICSRCNNITHLHVHHTTYIHHFYELEHLEDMIVLCSYCHDKEHGINPKEYKKNDRPRSKPRKERCVRCVRGEGRNKNKKPLPITQTS